MWQAPGRDRQPRDPAAEARAAQAITTLTAAAALCALWPLGITATAAYTTAWLAGMHPARLARAALSSLPMTAAYAIAATLQGQPWAPGHLTAWATRPYDDWKRATLALAHPAALPAAYLAVAPLAIPAGLAIGAGLWAWRSHHMTHGLMGATALAPAQWDSRQWNRQAATARRDARQPGRAALTTRTGVTAGTVIRAVRARWTRVLAIPLPEFNRHMVIVGASGSGKTTLMIRLWAGWMAAALSAARQGKPRPLLVIIDAKGGHDSISRARETYHALTAAGATRIAAWPYVPLSMWDLGPRELATLLHQLIEHGDGAASYYADMSQAVIRLAVMAPQGPPRSSGEFLTRLSPGWLERAYAEGDPAQLEQVTAAKAHIGDIAMRYTVLLSRLGPALDGREGITLEHADAWYCILEGTAEPSVAEAQAMALIELVARAATTSAGRRTILLAADDYSAVSRRVPLSNLYERGRSLGLGVQVSAQSWEGLGADDDERKRITSTADGGIWLMRTPSPEPLVTLAGTRRVLESGRKLLGPGVTGDEGTSRIQHTWVVDPDRIRQLGTGQAAYIRHGTATFVNVIPAPAPAQAPASQPAAPAQPPARHPRPRHVTGPQPPAITPPAGTPRPQQPPTGRNTP